MQFTHTLTIPRNQGEPIHISVGTIDDEKDLLEKSFAQRQRIYKKYGYLNEKFLNQIHDYDIYDAENKSVHIAAVRDNRLLGSLRLIHTDPLPITSFFDFEEPKGIEAVPIEKKCEISRLVVERSEDDYDIPRNILMLLMTSVAQEVARDKGYEITYAYVKDKLLSKLNLLKSPFAKISDFECIYPKDGLMAPYFYDQADDPVIPVYTTVEEGIKFLDGILGNSHLFTYDKETNGYEMRDTMYMGFLKRLGIVK